MPPLSRRFYSKDAVELAVSLLGRTFVHESKEGTTAGRIVEVEAYGGTDDPGSHASRGRTTRNATMFGPAGHLYVYFTYGMHYCANVVAESDGVPGAVLLRAVEPLEGLGLMEKRRGLADIRLLARGPGRLCQAFGIGREQNGADLARGPIFVEGRARLRSTVRTSPRIGLSREDGLYWRFFEEGPWGSKR